ncbi:hypothetical protein [Paenibacillus graminis]|uniref:Glycosylase n=1 Tax=Paenibacillus graminis TaxID=189425 RepID=A0A089MH35_9BACL|nr:hypothetical protein [Paenibacillus graminis]AIQ71705.1 hypothetical protein PGRAT_32040 [Paenibacillus graminis]
MKWHRVGPKDGLIFDPQEYGLNFAKSPQAVVYDTYLRVYFSFCKIDERQKYISEVAFIDIDKTFSKILNLSTSVLANGELGCFDEHGVFPFSPFKYEGKIYGYTSGWSRRVSVSTDTGIGLTISNDGGKTFKRVGNGPVLTSSLEEPFLVIDGFVRYFNGLFHMWYIYGTQWIQFPGQNEPDRVYKIGHAVSNNGLDWEREGRQIISEKIQLECQALPSVVFFKNRYHMFFCYRYATDFRKNREKSYRIGYAYSDDLVNWTRADEIAGIRLPETGWDSGMQCYPNVFEMGGTLYMLYNGNDFGKTGFGILELVED